MERLGRRSLMVVIDALLVNVSICLAFLIRYEHIPRPLERVFVVCCSYDFNPNFVLRFLASIIGMAVRQHWRVSQHY